MRQAAKTVEVGSAKAAPGTVARGAIPVTTLAGGSAVEIPVVVINGSKPGPVLWVDGAIHGDEPEGPLCCQILMREVKPQDLSGTLVLVPVINVAAYEAASRGNPLDTFSHDMNRIYPGRAEWLPVRARRLRALRVDDEGRRYGDLHSFRRRAFLSCARDVHRRAAGIGGTRNRDGAGLGLHDVVLQSEGQSDGGDGRGRQGRHHRRIRGAVRTPRLIFSPKSGGFWRMRSSMCSVTTR